MTVVVVWREEEPENAFEWRQRIDFRVLTRTGQVLAYQIPRQTSHYLSPLCSTCGGSTLQSIPFGTCEIPIIYLHAH